MLFPLFDFRKDLYASSLSSTFLTFPHFLLPSLLPSLPLSSRVLRSPAPLLIILLT